MKSILTRQATILRVFPDAVVTNSITEYISLTMKCRTCELPEWLRLRNIASCSIVTVKDCNTLQFINKIEFNMLQFAGKSCHLIKILHNLESEKNQIWNLESGFMQS